MDTRRIQPGVCHLSRTRWVACRPVRARSRLGRCHPLVLCFYGPHCDCAKLTGSKLAGGRVGGILAPFFISWLIRYWGWRASFFVSGIVGLGLAVVCYTYVTSRPEEHPKVNAAELALIHGASELHRERTPSAARVSKVPWRKILDSRSTWGLMVSHFCLVYPVYIFFTWFFVYVMKTRGMTMTKASFWA